MKSLIPVFLLILPLFSVGRQIDKDLVREADRLIPEMLEIYKVPGLSVAIVKENQVILCKGYGLSNVVKNSPFDKNTPGMLASATKFFTNLSVLKAVENGIVDLDLPLKTYIPGVRSDWGDIPLWRLLNLTSGIPSTDKTPFAQMNEEQQRKLTYRQYFDLIKDMPLDFQPGTNWRYQQTTFAMMAMIISEKTGKSWQDIVQQSVLDPAGMKHTHHLEQISNPADLPVNYEVTGGRPLPAKFFYPLVQSTGAGYNTTASDMANLFLTLNSGKIVPLKLIEREVFAKNRIYIQDSVTNEGYSIASEIESYGDFQTMGHPGGMGIAVIRYSPDQKIGVAVLANEKNTRIATLLTDKLLNSLLGGIPLKKQKTTVAYAIRRALSRTKLNAEQLHKELSSHKDTYDFTNAESGLNSLGYSLLRDQHMVDDALKVFALNALQFPQSANVYDSLGELYLKMGNKKLAIINYEKCLSLNSKSETALKALKELKSGN